MRSSSSRSAHVLRIEDPSHRPALFELLTDRIQVLLAEDLGVSPEEYIRSVSASLAHYPLLTVLVAAIGGLLSTST